MAGIYKRGGVWWGRVQRAGREHRQSLKTTARHVAEKRLAQWIERLEASEWGDKERRTFDELAMVFMDQHLRLLKPSSARRYVTSLRLLTPFLEGKFLDEITSAGLSEYENTRRRNGASAPTVRRDLACLSSMFSTALEMEWFDKNPVPAFLKARKRRGLRESPPRRRYLSHDEEGALLGAAPAYLEPMIAFAIDTGLRLDEQLSLTWDRVDLKRGRIFIENTKSHLPREVPLLPRAGTILGTVPRHIRSPFVFHKSDGSRYGKLTRGLLGAERRAGLTEHVKWHDLRRTCGCRLIQDHRLSIYEVSRWLGHESVQQTERAYAFLEGDNLHGAISGRTKAGTGRADS